MRRLLYDLIYRFFPVDWVFGPTSQIEQYVDLAIDGRIKPGSAITLGCGVGRETIYLAKKGFNVIGLDFSPTAIQKARAKAKEEGVEVEFIVDDLTNLQHTLGTYDLVMDFGAFNDLSQGARDLYMKNVLPMIKPGDHYIMFSFDKMLHPDEVTQRFSDNFIIEVLHTGPEIRFPGVLRLYWMSHKQVE